MCFLVTDFINLTLTLPKQQRANQSLWREIVANWTATMISHCTGFRNYWKQEVTLATNNIQHQLKLLSTHWSTCTLVAISCYLVWVASFCKICMSPKPIEVSRIKLELDWKPSRPKCFLSSTLPSKMDTRHCVCVRGVHACSCEGSAACPPSPP